MNHNKFAILPELLERRIDACATYDEGPEFPAKTGTEAASRCPFDFVLQIFENARYAHEDRDSIVVNEIDELARMHLRCQCDSAFEEQRDEHSLRLPEHVTQRQEIKNPYGLEWTRPLSIFPDLILKRPKIGTDVPVTMNHALRIACCAGRVDDFDDVVRSDVGGCELPHRPERCDFVQSVVVDHQPGLRLRLNPADEVG